MNRSERRQQRNTTATNSYASSVVTWYDAANRPMASANIGHESGGGTRYVFGMDGSWMDSDGDGLLDITEAGPLQPNTSDDYIVTKVEYDAAGNAYRQTDNAGRITQTNRDLLGRSTKTIENYVDGNVTETEASDTDRTTEYVYDSKGRLSIQRALNPKGAGLGVEQQDTRYLYGDLTNASLVTNTIYPDSADADASGTDQVKFTYDRLGRKLTSTDQRGVVHTYAYDAVGRLLSDAVTTLPTGVDGAVRRVEYVYQDDGKISTITTFDAASGGNIVNQVKYTYDGWGDIKSEQSHTGAVTTGTPAVTYSYEDGADANGNAMFVRLKKVTYPGGRLVYYLYENEPAGRLTSICENADGSQAIVGYTYLGMNTIVKETRPRTYGGLNLSYGANGTYAGWDRFGRIASQEWRKDSGTLVDGYAYTYDRAGNRTSRANLVNSAFTEVYGYDGLNRLIDGNRNGQDWQSWGLDALGNWSTFTDGSTTQTRTANPSNEITDISGDWIDPTYDAAGNMVSGPEATVTVAGETTRLFFVYDAWNRLVAVKASSGGLPGATISTYAYDGRGFRTQKSFAGGDTYDYYYNENAQLIEVQRNGSTSLYQQYVWGQQYIDAALVIYLPSNNSVSLTWDANFDVTMALKLSNGSCMNRFVYTPYGRRWSLNASWLGAVSVLPLGHQGLLLDTETGMYYNRARYYHPTLGRFVQRDPMRYIDGANLYQYVRASPVSHLDPLGLTPNQHDAVSLTWLLQKAQDIQKSHPDAGCGEILDLLNAEFDGAPRYVYTRTWGWIDLNHFFGTAHHTSAPEWLILLVGWSVEVGQAVFGWTILYPVEGLGSSAFNSEDPPSNRAGVSFGNSFMVECMCGKSASDAIEHWFKTQGVDDPRSAPDWERLPAREDVHEQEFRDSWWSIVRWLITGETGDERAIEDAPIMVH